MAQVPLRVRLAMSAPLPRAGELVQVTRAASVQFTNPVFFRVIRVLDWTTYDGWVWIEGYQLDDKGVAVARRQIFVRPVGLVLHGRTAPAPVAARQAGRNAARGRRVAG